MSARSLRRFLSNFEDTFASEGYFFFGASPVDVAELVRVAAVSGLAVAIASSVCSVT